MAEICLNRPEKLNAVDRESCRHLTRICQRLAREGEVRLVILRGEGRAFCAGADRQEMADCTDAVKREQFLCTVGGAVEAVAGLPMPVIALVQGFALGAGLDLALAADLRIATPEASFGVPASRLGLALEEGFVRRLLRLVGPGRAAQLVLTGEPVAAETALAWGLVNALLRADEAERLLERWRDAVLATPREALRANKELLRRPKID